MSNPLTDVEEVIAPRRQAMSNGVDNGVERGIITLKIEDFHSRDITAAEKVNLGIAEVANLWYNNNR